MSIQVSGSDTLHQVWMYLTMKPELDTRCTTRWDCDLSRDDGVQRCLVWLFQKLFVNEDSVALFWREGVPVWYSLRNSVGSELVPACLLFPDSYVNRPNVEASSDSLGRIHCVFEISAGVCYAVYDPGTGEMFRDTIPVVTQRFEPLC